MVTVFFGLGTLGDSVLPTVSTVAGFGALAFDDFVFVLLLLFALFCDAPAAEDVEAMVSCRLKPSLRLGGLVAP